MATKTLLPNAPNQNYADGSNWSGGVAPAPGDTVIINVAPSSGPTTATNLAVNGQAITLSNGGQFFTTGTSSFGFDPTTNITTSLNDTNMSTNQDLQFGDFFTNNGFITDPNYIVVINTTANASEVPNFVNNGTITYNTNIDGSSGISPYVLNDFNAAGTEAFTNYGVINITSPTGANQGPTTTNLVTQVQITGTITGTGVVNVDGSNQNQTTGPSPTAPTNSVLEVEMAATGTETYYLNDGEIQFDAAAAGTVVFQDSSSILDLANVTNVADTLTINGFRTGDAIGLGTTGVTSAAYDNTTGKIDLFNGTAMVSSLNLVATGTQNYATATFTIVPYNGTTPSNLQQTDNLLPTSLSARMQAYLQVNAAAPCYCPGTLIRTDRGEVAVESLAIGDRLVTLDGTAKPIKWIGRRAFSGRFIEGRRDILPVCVHAGALGDDLPQRDLWISPLHAMYLDGVLVPAAELVNGVSVTQAAAVEKVEYIHLELDRHEVIWAEGAASESFVDDDSREMFHNAHEFAALYPRQGRLAAVFCAPRVEEGEVLEAVKRAIDLRAGLEVPGLGAPLRGSVDTFEAGMVTGWAQNPDSPEVPVCIEVLVGGRVTARAVANRFRPDLLAAGLGSGRHSFRVQLPAGTAGRRVEVRRVADGAVVGTLGRKIKAA